MAAAHIARRRQPSMNAQASEELCPSV